MRRAGRVSPAPPALAVANAWATSSGVKSSAQQVSRPWSESRQPAAWKSSWRCFKAASRSSSVRISLPGRLAEPIHPRIEGLRRVESPWLCPGGMSDRHGFSKPRWRSSRGFFHAARANPPDHRWCRPTATLNWRKMSCTRSAGSRIGRLPDLSPPFAARAARPRRRAFQFEVRPVVERVAQEIRNGGGISHEFLPSRWHRRCRTVRPRRSSAWPAICNDPRRARSRTGS